MMRLFVSIAIILVVAYLDIIGVIPAALIPWQVASLCLFIGVRSLWAALRQLIDEPSSNEALGGFVLVLPWGIILTVFGVLAFLSLFGIWK